MNYLNFERDIVVKYGIDIVGWTYETFINPSEMSTSLPPLRKLSDAIKDGTCRFVRLSQSEHRAREKEYFRKVDAGEVATRKERQDKGVPRGKRTHAEANDDNDSDDEGPSGSTQHTEQPPEKRRRTMRKATTTSKNAGPKSAAIIRDED